MINDLKVNQEVTIITDGKHHGEKGKILSITRKLGYRDAYKYEVIEVDVNGVSVMLKDWEVLAA